MLVFPVCKLDHDLCRFKSAGHTDSMSQPCMFVYRRTPKLLTQRNSHQLVHIHLHTQIDSEQLPMIHLFSLFFYYNVHGELHLGDSVVSGQSLNLLRTPSPVFVFAWPNHIRAVNRTKKLFVSVSVQLTNAQTSCHELHIGHLVSVSVGLLISVDL